MAGAQTPKKMTSSRDGLHQLQESQFSVSGLLKWRVNREASLSAKKEKLKSQQLHVENQKSAIDELRSETEAIKAENQALERDVATQVDNLAIVNKEGEKAKIQLNQISKMVTGIAAFSGKLNFLHQKQLASQEEIAGQLSQLSLEHGTNTKAARDARKKSLKDFENDFIKVFEAERKIQKENFENDKLLLKKKEEAQMLMKSKIESLASNTAQLTEQIQRTYGELQVLEEKELMLSEEERNLEALRDDLKTKLEMELNEESMIRSLQENVELKETELAKFTEDLEIVKDENTKVLLQLSSIEASTEETLEEEKNGEILISNLSNEEATLSQDLEVVHIVLTEVKNLEKQEEDAMSAKVSMKARVNNLNQVDRLKSELENATRKLSQEVHDYEKKVEDSNTEVTDRKKKLKEAEKVLTDLEQTMKSLTGRKEETAKEVESLKIQLDAKKSACLLHASESKEKDEKIKVAKRELEDLQQKCSKTEKSLMIWKAELEAAESNSKVEEERARDISVSKDLLKSEVEAKSKEKKTLEEARQEQKKSIEEARLEEESLKKEKKNCSAQLEKLTKEVRQAEKKLEKKKAAYRLRCSEAADTEAKLVSVDSEIASLSKQLEEDKEKLKKLDEAQAKHKESKGVLSALVASNKKVKKEITNKKRTLTSATKSKDKMKNQLGKVNGNLASIKSSVESLTQQLNKAREETEGLEEEKKALDEKLKGLDEVLEKDLEREEEKAQLTKRKLELEEELLISSREFKGILVTKEREFQTGYLKNIEEVIQEKERSLQSKKEELEENQKKALEVSSDVENLEISNQKLLQEVTKSRSELQALEEELRLKTSRAGQAGPAAAFIPEESSNLSKRPRFFKTPRSPPVYSSPLTPSPRKRLNTNTDPRPGGSSKSVRTLSQSVPSSPRYVLCTLSCLVIITINYSHLRSTRPQIKRAVSQKPINNFMDLMEFSDSSQSQ